MKTILITMLWLWSQAVAPQPAQTVPPAAPAAAQRPASDEYVIGPKDVIQITVFNEEALSRPALTVDAEGTVDCPLIGRVKVGGLTAREAEEVLKKRYSGDYLNNPSISVIVKEFRNMVVYVQGAVKNPGAVDLKSDPTLLAALTEAGSLSSDAGSYLIITRAPEGREATGPTLPDAARPQDQIRVPREDVDTGRAINFRLRAGDTIYVPKADKFFISGQVKSPGSFVLTERLNVLQALTLAGGTTDRAAKNRIYILRVVNGKEVKVDGKNTVLIQPNDTVIVPTRFF
jgi:polysaccharide export outer membrane protein